MAEIIPQGYKQTEVGVIPENWDVKKLGDFGTFKGGNGFPIKYQGDENGKYPFYKVSDMNNFGNDIFMINSNNYLSEHILKEIKPFIFPANTIVFAKIGAAIFLERKKILSKGSCMDNNMMGYILDKKETDFKFFFFLFKNINLGKLVSATALPSLNGKEIADLSIIVPSTKEEQSAIAQVLSDTDALIESLNKLIVKKKNIKQGTMQELLTGKRRLSGFSGEWELKKLGDVAQFHKGKGLPKSEITEDGRYKCIHYGELFTKYHEKIRDIISYTNKKENLFYSQKNDVLMPTSDVTPDGLATASCISENEVILGGDVLIIRTPKNILDGVFLAYGITLNKEKIMQLVTGSTVYHLYGSDMKQYEFDVPPSVGEQQAIAQILSDMDTDIETLERKRDKYKLIKTGMMQELLTGRIRLK